MITVIDAGIGNSQSVTNMVSFLGFEVEILSIPTKSAKYTHLILPGVGAFDSGMEKLNKSGWSSALKEIGSEHAHLIVASKPITRTWCLFTRLESQTALSS
jgi:imidazoleglycerol phosphate synthase glutamine amidotransferase subunit HisH